MTQFSEENQDENLLSRWSRRKQLSALELQKEDLQLQQRVDLQQQEVSEPDASTPSVILTDDDMPTIDSLHADSDFSGFMSTGVSDELRNLALRKLFKAPSFNLRDGLDEYDEDYTSFEKLGDIITSDMKHQIEMEAKKKLEQEANTLQEKEPEQAPIPDSTELAESEIGRLDDKQQIETSATDSNSHPENTQPIVETSDTQTASTVVNNE